ncbi:uncharacterized protein LOC108598859 [Drosophila busckii]|uniref:uncharacterized protein LOC108598859 n=1 Tax=Drosophila busckii TaxID=30019 RepID=UPI001432A9BF|nr:uncharacterized protein LOC108598859 [Drosophila busckii]
MLAGCISKWTPDVESGELLRQQQLQLRQQQQHSFCDEVTDKVQPSASTTHLGRRVRLAPVWVRHAVEMQALVHDIGHGPFSHNWEQVCGKSFDHEQNGLTCVDQIFADVKNPALISLRDDKSGRGVQLIKALIIGDRELLTYPMMGHGYIFDIVHNNRCGLDVDKWDYIRRDNKRLHVLSADEMDFNEVFEQARISPDGQRIEYRYDDYHRIYKLYVARWRLHVSAYQLPKALAFDNLLAKIVRRAQPNLTNIRADSTGDAWLELVDDKVLQLIAGDPLTPYLLKPERWIEIPACSGENPQCLCVRTEKLGPGIDMKPDEFYALYGDKRKQQRISRLMTSYQVIACFKLLE